MEPLYNGNYGDRSELNGRIGHFTVTDGSEAGDDLVLIQTFLSYYVNDKLFLCSN